ncbi:glycoside hydrolase domain-containing protein [Streptomyces sp. NPDC051940]|uniref:glycoside hydrolase domain-containing protein n=1 Tax=Streptomyces sp. NPDC051940 TaxID=3155675 RepID=UPI00341E9C00
MSFVRRGRRHALSKGRRRLIAVVAAAAAAAVAVPLALTDSATAEPDTSVGYPSAGSATWFSGKAFDACTAPPLTTIKAWAASPYRGLGVYISGVNRTCTQAELTAAYVTEVSRLGWRLLPIHKGLQPACGARATDQKISLTKATAYTQGTAAATEAVAGAKERGMLPGSALYNDIEHYDPADTACRDSVLSYLSGWTRKLHASGYLAGAYLNLNLGAANLADAYHSTAYARPDALWIARYDGVASLKGWTGITDTKWSVHQRAKQYQGDVTETWGGVTQPIDRNLVDAPTATVAHTYTAAKALTARTAPNATATAVTTYPAASAVGVVCQASGTKVGTTWVWDKLTDGSYVPDSYVSTPSKTTFSPPLPKCRYPWQVNAPTGLKQRTGPSTSYDAVGSLPNGALAWVACQKGGSKVGTTWVWNKLDNGYWVSDYYVTNPSNTTFSKPAPRC